MSGIHDNRYKKLFSNPLMVQELFESFVPLSFVKHLDFSSLEDTKKSFVTKEYKSRESDIIYKVKFKGKDAYIYLLLEFQSTVDIYMPIRMLRYIMEFYDDLTDNFRVRFGKLPPVFPLMLYNGDSRWSASESIRDVIDCSLFDEMRFIPDFSYFKIAQNEFSESSLLDIKNAVSAVFFTENTELTHFRDKIGVLKELLSREKPDIIKVFRNWILNFAQGREGEEDVAEIIETMLEGEGSMFLASLDRLEKKFKEKGREEGLEIGFEKGIYQKALETAGKLKSKGYDKQMISEITGLSIEEIEAI